MTATFDDRIDVQIVADSALNGPTQFNRLAILTPDAMGGDLVRWYATADDVTEDADISANAKTDLRLALSQRLVAKPLALVLVRAETKQASLITITGAHAGAWVLRVGSTDYTFTAVAEDAAGIAAGLKDLVTARTDIVDTIDGAALTLTGVALGYDFACTLTPPSGGTGTVSTTEAVSIDDDLAAAKLEDNGWYGVTAPREAVQESILNIAAWVESNEKLALLAVTSIANGEAIEALGYGRTAICYHSTTPGAFALAWAALKLQANPDETATSWDWAQLVGVVADTLSASDAAAARAANINLYLPTDFADATGEGVLADGLSIDTRVAKDWATARIREAVAGVIINASTRNEKIPYDNGGLLSLAAVGLSVLQRGERIGHFVAESSSMTAQDIVDVAEADILASLARFEGSTELSGHVGAVSFRVAVRTA